MNDRKPNPYLKYSSALSVLCLSFSAVFAQAPEALESQRKAVEAQRAAESQRKAVEVQRASVDRQRAAARQQRGSSQVDFRSNSGGFFEFPDAFNQTQPKFDCPALEPLALNRAIDDASSAYNVPSTLISAVVHQESGGYPCAVSDKGAQGLMQLMPATAASYGVTDSFDPVQNIGGGTRFLGDLLQRYGGDLNRVLGAYNAGPTAVDRADGVPPFPETLQYVRSVLDRIKTPSDPKAFPPAVR
jgi:soluble lytic murein transglycosylase-like protein